MKPGSGFRATRWVAIFLVAQGLYVLAQPFRSSPLSCFQGWPSFTAFELLRACATFSETAPSFWIGVAVAGSAIGVGSFWLFRR